MKEVRSHFDQTDCLLQLVQQLASADVVCCIEELGNAETRCGYLRLQVVVFSSELLQLFLLGLFLALVELGDLMHIVNLHLCETHTASELFSFLLLQLCSCLFVELAVSLQILLFLR